MVQSVKILDNSIAVKCTLTTNNYIGQIRKYRLDYATKNAWRLFKLKKGKCARCWQKKRIESFRTNRVESEIICQLKAKD